MHLIFRIGLASLLLTGCQDDPLPPTNIIPANMSPASHTDMSWMQYGGDAHGTRFVPTKPALAKARLTATPAWTYRTGDATNGDGFFGASSSFKATPIKVGDVLIVSTGFNRVHAVNAVTGQRAWTFDPKTDFSIRYSEMFTSRGVSAWSDPDHKPGTPCATRVFVGTLDARLFAVDAATGNVCSDFGKGGVIDLSKNIQNFRRGEYSLTSPVTIANGVVVVGSSIGDNGGAQLDNGMIRGFDARTGRKLWAWDPLSTSRKKAGVKTGAANMWSVAAADEALGLVYIPTTSPSPDFYGGERPGDNTHANSVVALDSRTGTVKWAYQIVAHDLWDYDLASQPLLTDIPIKDEIVPGLVLATKMGFVFILDRRTGEPLFPVEDRPVPRSAVPGETASPTQKFPSTRLHPEHFERWSVSEAHKARCDAMLADVRYDGIFTPPSQKGTLLFPGNPGGSNWGSMATHPETGLAFTVVNSLPTVIKLIPRKAFRSEARNGRFNGVDAQFTSQSGTPYGMARFDLFDRDRLMMCHKGPWSELIAVNLSSGEVAWRAPIGTPPGLADHPEASGWGFLNTGGPLVVGDRVYVGTRFDATLRSFDVHTGLPAEARSLPAQIHATPMAYEAEGQFYVAVTAGGPQEGTDVPGDYVVAYRLEETP